MLRAKQISNLSSSARSFFITGSRYNQADGSSCTSTSEDETHIPEKTPSISGPKSLASLRTVSHSRKASEGVSRPTSSIQKDVVIQASPVLAEKLVMAGITTLNIISDLANYKVPISSSRNGVLVNSSKNCVIDSSRPVSSIKSSSYVKPIKRENHSDLHPNKPASEAALSSKTKSNRYHGVKAKENTTPLQRPTTRVANTEHVVENVSQILRQFNWGQATEETLKNLNFSLDAFRANQILKQIQDYSVALGFFGWLKQKPGFRHDEHTYTTMVGILGRNKQFWEITKLLGEMVNDGLHPNVVTYNRIIHSYGRANYLKEAVNVFNQMLSEKVEPDRVTYCTLIDIHAKAGFLDTAMSMYGKMQEAGLSPDTFTYSVIINCLGKAGHLTTAYKIFRQMVEHGCVPNLVTYNIMIDLQAKARNYHIALKIFDDMQSAGFQPDKVTYNIVMQVLGHCGYLIEAEALFFEMQRKNWVPDEYVYGILVDLWGKSGNAEKAWEWYRAMIDSGLRPNAPICNSLLSAFLRVHRLFDAYNLVRDMVAFGISPSSQTYTLLLSCCTDTKSLYDMGFCHELMKISGHPAHEFLTTMPSSGPNGQNVRDHTTKFLDMMMYSEDRESKRGLFDAMVDFLYKLGLKEEAGSVWEVVANKSIYPEAVRQKGSSYWLINLHVMSDGTAVIALSRTLAWFRQQMLTCGTGPSRIDIVTGWGQRSRVTGSSLVRQAVQELLDTFGFPFFTEKGNSGCFVSCGESLSSWLLQSYVERMHLL